MLKRGLPCINTYLTVRKVFEPERLIDFHFKSCWCCLCKNLIQSIQPDPIGQLDVPSNWYSGGHGFDPRSDHISVVEIWS